MHLLFLGGLNYAWDINVVWAVVLQILVCVIFAGICLFMNETWQMQVKYLLYPCTS